MDQRLAAARRKIDAIDRRVLALLNRRLALAEGLAGLKPRVRDPRREAAVLKRACALSRRPYKAAAKKIYLEIIRQCRLLQS